MPETLVQLDNASCKAHKYQNLIPQIESLIENEANFIANLANSSSALKETFSFWWVGFYLVDKNDVDLVLGPFQVCILFEQIFGL
jgi:L-methionine (R)-S-oxide reductase